MKNITHGVVLLCEHCHQPFPATPKAPPANAQGSPTFDLCPRCTRNQRALVPVTCAQCRYVFPRLRSTVNQRRRRYYKRAFCQACHTERIAPKTIMITCSECGRSYQRTLQAELKSQSRVYQRRICPICQPAKMAMITCYCCRRQFPRKMSKVRKREREGMRRAMCPRCHDRMLTKQHQPKGGSK